MSVGLSGMAFTHSDIGGYTMINQSFVKYLRTKELLLRWCECSAFSDALYRTHEGNLPEDSAQVPSSSTHTYPFFSLLSCGPSAATRCLSTSAARMLLQIS